MSTPSTSPTVLGEFGGADDRGNLEAVLCAVLGGGEVGQRVQVFP